MDEDSEQGGEAGKGEGARGRKGIGGGRRDEKEEEEARVILQGTRRLLLLPFLQEVLDTGRWFVAFAGETSGKAIFFKGLRGGSLNNERRTRLGF